jgi:ATPase subunit of ABC transporter with duplicated ATPase domains
VDKLSNEQISEVLADAAGTLRAQQTKIAALEAELATRNTHDASLKLAQKMHGKGLDVDTPVEALCARLEKAAADGKFEAIAQAVELVGPDMGTKIAHLSDGEQRIALGGSDLERFIVGAAG